MRQPPAFTRQGSIVAHQNTLSNGCAQAISTILTTFYVVAYVVDNAGENVRKGTNCTHMPEIFLAQAATSVFLLVSYCCSLPCFARGAKAQVSGNVDNPLDNPGLLQGLVCILWTTVILLFVLLGLWIWSVEDYFHITDECWAFIEKEGSLTLKIAFYLNGILSLIVLCFLGLTCMCVSLSACCFAIASGNSGNSATSPLMSQAY